MGYHGGGEGKGKGLVGDDGEVGGDDGAGGPVWQQHAHMSYTRVEEALLSLPSPWLENDGADGGPSSSQNSGSKSVPDSLLLRERR